MFERGALATMMPRFVAAATSMLSIPTPARAIGAQLVGARDQRRVDLGRRAHEDAGEVADALLELGAGPVAADLDVEARHLQQLQAGLPDGLGDEHAIAHGAASVRSTTQSMQAVSARTSSGSIAGNIATRSWLRPSLR